jgi:hypothetical protein
MTRIEVFLFAPFARRPDDVVKGLRFPYDAALKDTLKASLARYRDRARDPARQVLTAGGWLGPARTWFVEPAVWPLVRDDLGAAGAVFVEVPRPADVPHYSSASVAEARYPTEGGQALPARVSLAEPLPESESWDDGDPRTLAAAGLLHDLVMAAGAVAGAPTHALGPGHDAIVRVPEVVWAQFVRQTDMAAAWRARALHDELDAAWVRGMEREA